MGVFQSGNGDNEDRWIKSSKDRSPRNFPAHVQHSFFLRRDRERRTLDGDGDLIIAPWDHIFADNVGSYRIEFILRRGPRTPVSVG